MKPGSSRPRRSRLSLISLRNALRIFAGGFRPIRTMHLSSVSQSILNRVIFIRSVSRPICGRISWYCQSLRRFSPLRRRLPSLNPSHTSSWIIRSSSCCLMTCRCRFRIFPGSGRCSRITRSWMFRNLILIRRKLSQAG